MSDINLSFKHGLTREAARDRLAAAISETQARFGPMVRRVEWSADRNSVHLSGEGFEVDGRVDDHEVHLVGNIPVLGWLLGGPFALGLKQIVGRAFQQKLT